MTMVLFGLAALFSIFLAVEAQTYYKPGGAKIVSHRTGPITGDCWQGELCKQRCLTNATVARFVGSINNVTMCCPFCERSGLYLSNSVCNCLHNGPDPKYQPTEEELREVEEFKRRLNGAPPTGIVSGGVMLMAVFGSVLSQYQY